MTNLELVARIDRLCRAQGMTKKELERKAGLSEGLTSKWKKSQFTPNTGKLQAVADVLGVPLTELLADTNGSQNAKIRRIPVLGDVAAGVPFEAVENVLDWEEIPETWTGEYFALRIKGDSMSPRIQDGDVVIVKFQPAADNGSLVIAKIDGENACCKRLVTSRDGITLQSLNPAYDPLYFSNREVIERPVTILGRVVELRAKFK